MTSVCKPQEMPIVRPGAVDVTELVIGDLQERRAAGVLKYGTTLQPFNGRKALVDAYQEAIDLVQYLRQEIAERAWLDAGRRVDVDIAYWYGALNVLKRCRGEKIVCMVCDGKATTPDQCGCGGWQTVEQAITHAEATLEILGK